MVEKAAAAVNLSCSLAQTASRARSNPAHTQLPLPARNRPSALSSRRLFRIVSRSTNRVRPPRSIARMMLWTSGTTAWACCRACAPAVLWSPHGAFYRRLFPAPLLVLQAAYRRRLFLSMNRLSCPQSTQWQNLRRWKASLRATARHANADALWPPEI